MQTFGQWISSCIWPPKPAVSHVVASINAQREIFGLGPLEVSPRLRHGAERAARVAAAFGRTFPEPLMARLVAVASGERLARDIMKGRRSGLMVGVEWMAAPPGRMAADRVVCDWMASEEDRAKLLGPYTLVGHGEAIDKDGDRYWVVNFA